MQQTIVIAEDHPVQARLLARLLGDAGYAVVVTHDGQAALAALRVHRAALVISDVRMTPMDGFELCRAIKDDPELGAIPVVLVTALSGVGDIVHALECGADNFVSKPYDQQALLGRVTQLLTPHGAVADVTSGTAHRASQRQILDLLLASFEEAVRLNHDLQRRQEEVTRLNLALRAGADELRTAYSEMEAFSYSVSHDLRSPLHAIRSFSGVLLQRHAAGLDARGLHYLERIVHNASRMEALIDALLDLARLTHGPVRAVRTDLGALARELIEECREREPHRQVEVHIAPDMVCLAEPALMRQVLANLLSNAWKFTSRAAQPRIEVGRDDELGVFHVRDNGAGFDMDNAGDLFGTFKRLHTDEDYPGLGIGLATVKRIIARHGGRIWAESAPGAGTTIRFTVG